MYVTQPAFSFNYTEDIIDATFKKKWWLTSLFVVDTIVLIFTVTLFKYFIVEYRDTHS
jgi:uncharacterized membrane protein